MRKTAWFMVSLIVFVIVGLLLFNLLTTDSRKMRKFVSEEERLQQILSISASNESKIKALTDFVNSAEKNFRLDLQSDEVPQEVYHDVVVCYVKLGNLYEEMKSPKAEAYFNSAIRLKGKFVPWIKHYKINTRDDLILYVAELDRKTKK